MARALRKAPSVNVENRLPQQPLTVAIASRDRVYRESLALPLRRFGFRVQELEMAANCGRPELAAIDVLVVDTDALSPTDLESINSLHLRWPLVEVVVVAGDLPVEEAVEALRAGFFTVLQHPVSDQLLVETIGQAGRRHHRARARLEELNRARYTTGCAGDPPQTGPAADPSEEVQ